MKLVKYLEIDFFVMFMNVYLQDICLMISDGYKPKKINQSE